MTTAITVTAGTAETAGPSAVRIEPAWDDPDAVLAVLRSAGDYWPLARYAASPEEQVATGADPRSASYVPPWFRCDVALEGEPRVPGAEVLLGNPRFVDAARAVFGADAHVRPTTVYVNVMLPSIAPFAPHLDVPAFRGFTRADHPIWLLKLMLQSGLFERWRVRLATAVSWFYGGPGGSFHYWPDGPDAPSARVDPPFTNVAVLADNERTFHGVAPVGTEAVLVEGLTRDSTLHRVAGGWEMRDGGSAVGQGSDDDVRVTVSWKAEIHADDSELARATSHEDDLTMAVVVDTFLADLARRRVDASLPDDPHHDVAWVEALSRAYSVRSPRVPR